MEKDNQEHTPLHVAAQFQGGENGADVVKVLLQHYPAAVLERDEDVWTAHVLAASSQGQSRETYSLTSPLKLFPCST